MTIKRKSVIQSFYPNKLSAFACSMFFAGCTIIIFYIISNQGDYNGGRAWLLNNTPVEIKYIFFLLSLLMTIAGLIPLFPNLTYVRITNEGIIYKGALTFFKEKSLNWNVIDDFHIQSIPTNESTKFVMIKFKKTYLPNQAEKNLVIFGDPKKVLDIMKQNLLEYSKKDPK